MRRTGRSAGAGLLLALALGVVAAPPAHGGAPGPDGLPSSLPRAPSWTATVGGAPAGPALAVYATLEQRRLTIIGAAHQVRVYDRPEWSLTADDAATMRLSPDGTRLAMPHWPKGTRQETRMLDLTDGSVRMVTSGAPLAWTADGRRLLTIRFEGDATTQEPHGGELRVVAIPSGEIVWRAPLAPRHDAYLALTAAFAPSGDAFAVQHGDDLTMYRSDGGGWRSTLDSRRLSGPAAFTEGGRVLMVTDRTGRLHQLDAATGRDTGAPPVPGPPGTRLVGWRTGQPVVVDGRTVRMLGDPAAVLVTAPEETIELEIAASAVSLPLTAPAPPRPGPFGVRYRLPLFGGGLLLVAVGAFTAWRYARRPRKGETTG